MRGVCQDDWTRKSNFVELLIESDRDRFTHQVGNALGALRRPMGTIQAP